MQLDVHLGEKKNYTVSYQFYDNPVAKLIYERMYDQENHVIDRTIFKNFGETVEELEIELTELVEKLNEHIGLETTDTLDKNVLHREFPKYNDIYFNDEYVGPLLRRFNTVIHHIEHISRVPDQQVFQFATEDDGVDMQRSWYELFTPYKKKGEMFMHYPHVGKHFLELFFDKDYNVPAEQIVLTKKVVNTFSFWCGKDRIPTPEQHKHFYSEMEEFYKKVQGKLPYYWGDPRLAIGYIPIGKCTSNIDDHIENISKNKYIHSWTLK